jgi:hypothetical protein
VRRHQIRHQLPPTSPGLSRPRKRGTTQARAWLAGETDPDPLEDKTDHTPADHAATIDSIHQSSSESNSEGDRGVYI